MMNISFGMRAHILVTSCLAVPGGPSYFVGYMRVCCARACRGMGTLSTSTVVVLLMPPQPQKSCREFFFRHCSAWTATTFPKDGAPFASRSARKSGKSISIAHLTLELVKTLLYCYAGEIPA